MGQKSFEKDLDTAQSLVLRSLQELQVFLWVARYTSINPAVIYI
jgi:hypothetical protein